MKNPFVTNHPCRYYLYGFTEPQNYTRSKVKTFDPLGDLQRQLGKGLSFFLRTLTIHHNGEH